MSKIIKGGYIQTATGSAIPLVEGSIEWSESMNNLRSHCHKAELITESSDEGTSFYRCGECKKPCNFQSISVIDTDVTRKE